MTFSGQFLPLALHQIGVVDIRYTLVPWQQEKSLQLLTLFSNSLTNYHPIKNKISVLKH
ncbi:Hypothetical protein ADU70_2128 [Pediococcus damnosus]|uniref:Uncharacterized protein n=1 Tax=Pediococcus damnosus TaxID=51663 RepID=A0AAC9B3J6_9LACO|nr:Hypothetical protein ADU70_2128 [Pediococcus damnosus]